MIRSTSMLRMVAASLMSLALSMLPAPTDISEHGLLREALLKLRRPIPVSREILLVQSDLESDSDWESNVQGARPADVIWALVELGAERALLPPSWPEVLSESGDTVDAGLRSRISDRLDEEFSVIDENVAELFRAIRLGYIKPEDAVRFVEELRRLVDGSEARIRAELNRQATDGGETVDQLVEAFGRDRLATDLSDLSMALPSYRFAVAVPAPPSLQERDFRRLPISSLLRYVHVSGRLEHHLREMDEAGYFDEVAPRDRPRVLFDYVRTLRRDLALRPTEERAAAWREALFAVYASAERLIDAAVEERLVAGLAEELEGADVASLRETAEALSAAFAEARTMYEAFTELRATARNRVAGSLVILAGDDSQSETSRVDLLAITANSVLVGEHFVAPVRRYKTLLLVGGGILVALLLLPFRTGHAAMLAPAALAPASAVFVVLFTRADIWIDPRLVVAVLLGAALASVLVAGVAQARSDQAVVGSATARLPSRSLRWVFHHGGLPLGAARTDWAAVVAVSAERETWPQTSPSAGLSPAPGEFHRIISRQIRKLGGTVLGEDGWTVLAGFGTPVAKKSGARGNRGESRAQLAERVCRGVRELVSAAAAESLTIRCGVDMGEITFYTSPIGGYRATGRPVAYARRLCSVTRRHGCSILAGDQVVRLLVDGAQDLRFREVGLLVQPDGDGRYQFHELTGRDLPSV